MRTGFTERKVRIEELDRLFDLKFWKAQKDSDKFDAAWELVVNSFIIKGKDVRELRLQRNIRPLSKVNFYVIKSMGQTSVLQEVY